MAGERMFELSREGAVPVLSGRGIRLYDQLTQPIELLVTEASGNPHVTHVTYRVVK
jgi:hypothetical protein